MVGCLSVFYRILLFLVALVGVAGCGLLGVGFMTGLKNDKDAAITSEASRSLIPAEEKAKLTEDQQRKLRIVCRFAWSYVFYLSGAVVGLFAAIYIVARRKYLGFLMTVVAVGAPYALSFPIMFELAELSAFNTAQLRKELGGIPGILMDAMPGLPEGARMLVLFTGWLPVAGLLGLLVPAWRPPVVDEPAPLDD